MFHQIGFLVKHGETFGETFLSFCAILRHFAIHEQSQKSSETPINPLF